MFKGLEQGQRLLQQSLSIIRIHKKLSLFPALNTLICMILLTLIIMPLSKYEHLRGLTHPQLLHFIGWYVAFLLVLFLIDTISHFFFAALVVCVDQCFNSEKPSLMQGFTAAVKEFWKIYLWTCFSASVGNVLYIFYVVIKKTAWAQRLLNGLTWPIAIYFVIPIIMLEKLNPVAALEKSSQLIKNTWGAPVIAHLGYFFWFVFFRIVAFIPIIVGLARGGKTNLIIGSIITTILFMIIAAVRTTSRIIILTALYRYAAKKQAPQPFQQATLEHAFTRWNP